ncbi:MAG: hypothetical protein KDJ38_03115 [Gammaproteobacteria bacterium]|nr:hypothetical protein [Gammaproteobacteria bacterium]
MIDRQAFSRVLLPGLLAASLVACASNPPRDSDDLCRIFEEKRAWYKAAIAMEERWDVPLNVPMAILYQESGFVAKARAPRNYTFFGLIPWGRKSSAYGYSQALDGTWQRYIDETGNRGADRDDFDDAIDFVGWYVNATTTYNRVARDSAYHQYLNYHEGWTGYRSQRWAQKPWLKDAAARVDTRARRYAEQFQACKEELSHGFWYRLFH